jgi:hypothetical protein
LEAQLVQKREKNRGGKDGMRRLINEGDIASVEAHTTQLNKQSINKLVI